MKKKENWHLWKKLCAVTLVDHGKKNYMKQRLFVDLYFIFWMNDFKSVFFWWMVKAAQTKVLKVLFFSIQILFFMNGIIQIFYHFSLVLVTPFCDRNHLWKPFNFLIDNNFFEWKNWYRIHWKSWSFSFRVKDKFLVLSLNASFQLYHLTLVEKTGNNWFR